MDETKTRNQLDRQIRVISTSVSGLRECGPTGIIFVDQWMQGDGYDLGMMRLSVNGEAGTCRKRDPETGSGRVDAKWFDTTFIRFDILRQAFRENKKDCETRGQYAYLLAEN